MKNLIHSVRLFRRTSLRLGVLASAALVAGCAVLTVDVDVYKGPLTNEKSIQMHQLAAMLWETQWSLERTIAEVENQIKDIKKQPFTDDEWEEIYEDCLKNLNAVLVYAEPLEVKNVHQTAIAAKSAPRSDEKRTGLLKGGGKQADSAKAAEKLADLTKAADTLLGSTAAEPYRKEFTALRDAAQSGDRDAVAKTTETLRTAGAFRVGFRAVIEDALNEYRERERKPSQSAREELNLSAARYGYRIVQAAQNTILTIKQRRFYKLSNPGPRLNYAMMMLSASGNTLLTLANELQYDISRQKSGQQAAELDLHQLRSRFLTTEFRWLQAWQHHAKQEAQRKGPHTESWEKLRATLEKLASETPRNKPDPLGGSRSFTALQDHLKGEQDAEIQKKQLELLKHLQPSPTDQLTTHHMTGDTPWAVATALLSMLIYEKAEQLRDGLPTNDLDDAIKTIELYRARLAAVRPAGAILRMTTPITELQSNGDADDPFRKNMLVDSVMEMIPLPNLPWPGTITKTIEHRLASSLDKVSWQPINRIKVHGSGDTNYVLVKDDLGNWYVKHYAADPEPIFKGVGAVLTPYLQGRGVTLGGLGAAATGASPASAPATAPAGDVTPPVATINVSMENDSAAHTTELAALRQRFVDLVTAKVKETDASGALRKTDGANVEIKVGGSTVSYDSGTTTRLAARLKDYDEVAATLPLDARARKLVEAAQRFPGDVAVVQDQVAGKSARAEIHEAVQSYIEKRRAALTALRAGVQTTLLGTIK